MNLPNKLTLARVLMIPVFVALVFLSIKFPYLKYAAVAVFIIASLTDLFDGKIARKYNLVTNFGKFMDPLADKLLVCTAMILLVFLRPFSAEHCLLNADAENIVFTIVILLIVAREFIISGFRLIAAEHGLVLAAIKVAKWKTTVQMIMIIALLLNFEWLPFMILEWTLILAALVLTIVSLVAYLVKNWHVMKDEA